MKQRLGAIALACVSLAATLVALKSWLMDGPVPSPDVSLLLWLPIDGAAERAVEGSWRLPLLIAILAGSAAYALLLVGLWLQSRGGPGSGPLLTATMLGILASTVTLLGFATNLPAVYHAFPVWLMDVYWRYISSGWTWALQAASLFLLSLGLLRSRLVWGWVGVLGICSSALFAGALLQLRLAHSSSSYSESTLAIAIFFVSLTIALCWRAARPLPSSDHNEATPVELAFRADGAR